MVSESETGVILPYEKAAIAGDEMPDGLTSPDKWLFLSLRLLYSYKRMGMVDKATAIREKRKLLEDYQHLKFQEDVQARMVETYKRAEIAACDYRKNPTIANADRLLEALYGIGRKNHG